MNRRQAIQALLGSLTAIPFLRRFIRTDVGGTLVSDDGSLVMFVHAVDSGNEITSVTYGGQPMILTRTSRFTWPLPVPPQVQP